ncbi:hypothetical protein JHW43_004722 [Diplocarpon mali]|nr:hypothetical protein JHW43_004722 [Diplocarpon mali]
MASIAETTYYLPSRHVSSDREEVDFPLYPDPSMFSHNFSFSTAQNFNMEPYACPRTQDGYPTNAGSSFAAQYADATYPLESPDLRAAPSNYSTASGPSATSSVMGSPNSIHGHVVPAPEWVPHGLGLDPSIVSYESFAHGNEYTYQLTGMDDFASEVAAKPNGFVDRMRLGAVSISEASPITPVSAAAVEFSDEGFRSPLNACLKSPKDARRTSQAFAASFGDIPSPLWAQDQRSPVSGTPYYVSSETSLAHAKYHQSPFVSQSSGNLVAPLESSCRLPLTILASCYALSLALSGSSANERFLRPINSPPAVHRSPDVCNATPRPLSLPTTYIPRIAIAITSNYPYPPLRRPSLQSYGSQDGNFSSEESKEKGRCSYPECGKVFKDLKAHMLTHQNERPEKCPIQTCDYHIKGFARKYDKNRHTLTHYKGTMVCGFCPGSGSAAEKSFNRADVFKRHLTSVHAVEQTPPNSRKKISSSINSIKSLSGYAPDATGKCSTCSGTFGNAQDFYEHLDDCVLRIVQQEEPSEAINAARLAEVEQDHDVHQTLRNHALPITTTSFSADEDEDDEEFDDENDDDFALGNRSRKNKNRNAASGVQKSRGLTHAKGGVTLHTKGRKKRKDYPSSWGAPTSQMKMKKRVLCVFDGSRRLWKDDMMLDTDYEVRMKLQSEKAYVTDLDVQTMHRADALHQSTEEEKGPWIADDLTGIDLEKLMEIKPQ